MLKRIPLKKDHLLFIGIVLMLFVCYQMAFKKTFDAWQTNKNLNNQKASSANLSYQPAYVKRKSNNLDNVIAQYRVDTINFRNNAIITVATIAGRQDAKLSEVPIMEPAFKTDKFIVQKFTLEGDFFSLTKTLNNLQNTGGIGLIRSVSYRLDKMDKGKLYADVYLEILK